jgi:hypothetical protein
MVNDGLLTVRIKFGSPYKLIEELIMGGNSLTRFTNL